MASESKDAGPSRQVLESMPGRTLTFLRGVSLLGINSSATLRPVRLEVWKRIATDLRPRHLDSIVTRTISFDDLPGAFTGYLHGSVIGRTVVKIAK